jgi:hypothetical protein
LVDPTTIFDCEGCNTEVHADALTGAVLLRPTTRSKAERNTKPRAKTGRRVLGVVLVLIVVAAVYNAIFGGGPSQYEQTCETKVTEQLGFPLCNHRHL